MLSKNGHVRQHPTSIRGVGPHSHKVGNFSENDLGEPSDAEVGTLLVSNYSTSSSSCTVRCKGEAERGVNV